jgi:hypothetical protein
LQPPLKTGVTADSHIERLSYLAAHVLSLDDNGRPLQADGVWGRVFIQLSNQVECVKAAAAAFGAAYESSLNDAVVRNPHSAWLYYGSALARLRSDLNNETAGPESLALASILLACVEVLSQHEKNGLAHFRGAIQIVTQTHHHRHPSAGILRQLKDELIKMELTIGSYSLSQTPQPMHLDSQDSLAQGDDPFRDPDLAINAALLCLHQSYQFIQSAAQFKYKYPSWKDHDPIMCNRHSNAIANCDSVLSGLTTLATTLQSQYSPTTSPLKSSDTLAEIYALRAQLTATTIFLHKIHSPFQTGYDAHLDRFRTIVSDAAASARLRRRTKAGAFNRFSTRPGIVGPLFFVAMKCRDPGLRALARAMLKELGREGPADGRIMAAVGERLDEIEMARAGCGTSSTGGELAAGDVPEGQRVHGYGVRSSRVDGEGRRVVDVQFSRPRVPLMEGWGEVDYSSLDNWTFWTEPIEI